MPACNASFYEYYVRQDSPTSYYYYQWNKNTKTVSIVFRSTAPTSDYFPLEDGALLDIRQNGNYVEAVFIDYSSTNNFYLKYVRLLSTSGGERNKLMVASRSGGVCTVRMYEVGLKEVTILTLNFQTEYTTPISNYPAGGYVYPEGTFSNTPCFLTKLYSWDIYTCDGYTRNRVNISGPTISNSFELNSAQCGYAAPVEGEFPITETKRFQIFEPCKNPVYILWFNSLGGPEQWLFTGSQRLEMEVTNEGYFETNYNTIDQTTNPRKSTIKRAQSRMKLGAKSITHNEKEVLLEIMTSPAVYIVGADLSIQKRVNPIEGTFQIYDTATELTDIEFEILLPETLTYGN